jgi:hypothetical protein
MTLNRATQPKQPRAAAWSPAEFDTIAILPASVSPYMIHTHMSDFFHASCGLEDEASRVAGPGTQGAGMKALVSVETHAATPRPRVDCSLPFMTFYTRNRYQARDGAFSRGAVRAPVQTSLPRSHCRVDLS